MYLYRAIDSVGDTVEFFFSEHRDLLAGAAKRQVMLDVEHWSHKGLNNRAETSHLPLRKRERGMQGFRSPSGLQRFVTIFSAIRNLFVPTRNDKSAAAIRAHRYAAFKAWNALAGVA